MGVEHVGQKSRLDPGVKANAFSFDVSTFSRGSGQRTCAVYKQPLTCLQDQQWQMGAVGRGSSDLRISVVKMFALHKQCEVSVTVEALTEAMTGNRESDNEMPLDRATFAL